MSRNGKKPIDNPEGVEVKVNGSEVTVKGPKGTLTQSYYTWSRTLPCGEITIKDKKWLSVPNGWEGRKKYYASYIGIVSHWENETLLEDAETDRVESSDNIFVYNLLIPLEDV